MGGEGFGRGAFKQAAQVDGDVVSGRHLIVDTIPVGRDITIRPRHRDDGLLRGREGFQNRVGAGEVEIHKGAIIRQKERHMRDQRTTLAIDRQLAKAAPVGEGEVFVG